MKTDVLLKNYTEKALQVMDEILTNYDLPSPMNKGFEYNDISVISNFNLGLNWEYLDDLLLKNKTTIEQVQLGSNELVDQLLAYNEKYDRRVENGVMKAKQALEEYRTSTVRIALELADMAEEYYDNAVQNRLIQEHGHLIWNDVKQQQLSFTQDTKNHNVERVIAKVQSDLKEGTLNLSIEKEPALLGLRRYLNRKLNSPEYFGIIFRSRVEVVFDYMATHYGRKYEMAEILTAYRMIGEQNIARVIETVLKDDE